MKQLLMCVIIIITVVLQSSCTFYGITNDYNKLDENYKPRIKKLSNFQNLDKGFIYEINATQLKEELRKYPKSMVYLFANLCGSKDCKPLTFYESYAEENGYKLFLIMIGYAHLNETLKQNINNNLFSINSEFYEAKSKRKYLTYFENELMGQPKENRQKEYLGNIFFFEFGDMKKICKTLTENE